MKTFVTAAALGMMLAGTVAIPAAAEARGHSRSVSVQGANGRGYDRMRSVSRQPGSVAASRSLQTNGGQGVTSNRSGSWADGAYSGGATHSTNNGTTWGRSTNVVNNGDGSYSSNVTRTRPDGSTGSVSRTVDHD